MKNVTCIILLHVKLEEFFYKQFPDNPRLFFCPGYHYKNIYIKIQSQINTITSLNYNIKLKNSGYNCKFRKEILDSGLKAFEKMTEDDKKGIKPMYRGKEWNADERKRSKSKKKLNW